MSAPRPVDRDDEAQTTRRCVPLTSLYQPVQVGQIGSGHAGTSTFFRWPILGALLFDNESSDARDHCANERTFLSYLRLSVLMAIVSMAMTLSFHLKLQPTALERHIAKPLGAIFWLLAVLILVVGISNYIRTVNLYSKRAAIVQSGWRTQTVLGFVSACIFGTCIVLLVINTMRDSGKTTE
ncbi:hypothetical protein ISF_03286 [Cordyceps fumosorosea ARSEF 2679]|uniref:DUF202 domain-containing protein n=1 Tax=Cordyceps fumosorosea (strain ARSEF 2679) TaxID=1081104 RepID=A0A168ALI5_CORFA|nr:hypothetical protein ISF_03286 [Cordyceps fumosorosea ARSEF 2679]OAA68911.1 hypothetical protein ISF_03286 [Cordyceps fumosorosea ARSEF 2679]